MIKSIFVKMLMRVITTSLAVTGGIAGPAAVSSCQNTADVSIIVEAAVQTAETIADAEPSPEETNTSEKTSADQGNAAKQETKTSDRKSAGKGAAADAQKSADGQKTADAQTAGNAQKTENAQQAENVQNTGNAQQAENVQSTGNAQQAENVQSTGNAQQAENVQNTGNAQQAENVQSTGNAQQAENVQNTDNAADTAQPETQPETGAAAPQPETAEQTDKNMEEDRVITSNTATDSVWGYIPPAGEKEPAPEETAPAQPAPEEPEYIEIHDCNCGWNTTDYDQLKKHMYNHAIKGERYSYTTVVKKK